ncbi:MAG: 30S ribosomal protein S6 [Spirochaetales bacterium]|nr:30S ribosomal protein S6 [Spirochaetales bacterium]MCF7937489.1 30S ribosomal protein S6 [Spirochaetales bacterium]
MRTYELMTVFRSDGEAYEKGRANLKEHLSESNVTIVKEEDRGDRQLAYELKGNERGHYHLYELELDPELVNSLDQTIQRVPELLKHLFVRKES